MRYAIVSDLHANWQAWRAVREDIFARGADSIVCLGDVVGYGPSPTRVLSDLRKYCSNFVLGNHDAAAAGLLDLSLFNDNARRSAEWTARQFDAETLQSLGQVPLVLEDEDAIFVHAETPAPDDFGYVEETDDARACFGATDRRFIFIGHTHVPQIFALSPEGRITLATKSPSQMTAEEGFRYLVNVGSVGDPGDGTDTASYCIFDSQLGTIELCKVPFDTNGFLAELKQVPELGTPWFLQHREGEQLRPSHDQIGAGKVSGTQIRVTASRAKVRVRAGALTAAPSTILEKYKAPAKPKPAMDPKKTTIMASSAIIVVAAVACLLIWKSSQPRKPAEAPGTSGVEAAPAAQPAGLAVRIEASAEEAAVNNLAAMAMDGNAQTRWCSGDGMLGHWLSIDLGSPQKLGGMEIAWEFPEMSYGANIEASNDERRWKMLASHVGTGGQHIAFAATSRFVRISVTKLPAKKYASIGEVRLFDDAGREIKIAHVSVPSNAPTAAPQQVITLQAGSAKLHGRVLRIEDVGGAKNIGWWNELGEHVSWDLQVGQAGTYEVELLFSLPKDGDNNQIAIMAGKSQVTVTLHPTDAWTTYKTAKAGRIHLDGGPTTLLVKALKARGAVVNIRSITLRRSGE